MKHEGRGVIRRDDKTDHGEVVTPASSGAIDMGKPVAVRRDMTYCPVCKGSYPIKSDGLRGKHDGQPYAYHGDLTECGVRLVSRTK